jgi:hypothetical protein
MRKHTFPTFPLPHIMAEATVEYAVDPASVPDGAAALGVVMNITVNPNRVIPVVPKKPKPAWMSLRPVPSALPTAPPQPPPPATTKPRPVHDDDVRSRTEGAEALARNNPHDTDAAIDFDEPTHVYRYNDVVIPISVTTVVERAFDPDNHFDGPAVVDKWFEMWRRKGPAGEYGDLFAKLENGECTPEDVKLGIIDRWATAGPLGTEMHRAIEVHCNVHIADWSKHSSIGPHTNPLDVVHPELKQFDEFASGAWVAEMGLVPFRTELSTVYVSERTGRVLCAGQIDLLAVDKHGNYHIIDWKRVKPKYAITEFERAYRGKTGVSSVLAHLPDTKFYHYSLQASMYAVMAAQSHGWDAEGRLRLLRMHRDRGTGQLVLCADLRAEAKQLLEELDAQ